MRALYIVGIVLSVVFLFVIAFFVAEVESARYMSYYNYDYNNTYSSYSYNSFSNYGSDETMTAAIVSFFFFVYFILTSIFGLIKVKTKTNKVLSIIGLCISGIFFLWNLLVMIDPGSLSFDEVGGGWAFYSLIMLAFMIVGLVQAVRFLKRAATIMDPSNSDILDS